MRLFIGVLVIVIGLALILENLEVISHELDSLLDLWPLLILVLGIRIVMTGIAEGWRYLRRKRIALGKMLFGLLLTGLGLSFLSRTTGMIDFHLSALWDWTWPILLIYIGIKVLFDRNRHHDWFRFHINDKINCKKCGTIDMEEDFAKEHFHKDHFIGDINWGKNPWKIGHKSLQVGVGDVDIDFTKAILDPGENVFVLKGWVGSVEMLVPGDLPVHLETSVRVGDVTVFDENYSGTGRAVTYTSPGYQEADTKLKILVKLSIGEVEIHAVD